ncbi:hypothetical protein PIB30_110274, partial [Stylosanthes scabra]|nr:hypothetical protein [Stylosanthes scabra]
MAILPAFTIVLSMLFFLNKTSNATTTDTITQSQSLQDGETLVSEGGSFELGFFTPGSSTNNTANRYVGIWYKNVPIRTVVWVANRDNPINENSSVLSITKDGQLLLLNGNNTVLWSTNATTTKNSFTPVAQLLDTGNLVVRDEKNKDPENYLWQSFDYPSDTFLPGMKLGWDFRTGLNRRLTAWRNWDDPSPGDYTSGMEPNNNPETMEWKGSEKYFRIGPFDGIEFSGSPSLKYNPIINYTYVFNKNELYTAYFINDKSVITRIVLNETIYAQQRLTWDKDSQSWRSSNSLPGDYCDDYNLCGAFGMCVVNQSP